MILLKGYLPQLQVNPALGPSLACHYAGIRRQYSVIERVSVLLLEEAALYASLVLPQTAVGTLDKSLNLS